MKQFKTEKAFNLMVSALCEFLKSSTPDEQCYGQNRGKLSERKAKELAHSAAAKILSSYKIW
jgi:hypothetical protein